MNRFRGSFRLTLFIVSILMVFSGCNNDIFIDGKNLPDYTEVTVDGDGGQWSTAFSRDGLVKIYISNTSSAFNPYYRYYGINSGEVDSDCPPAQLGEIIYENPAEFFSIGFVGDMIYFSSNYNALNDDTVNLCLEYDYGVTKQITINITHGKPLEQLYAICSAPYVLKEKIDEVTRRTSLTNNSSLTQKLEIQPYLEAKCRSEVVTTQIWANMMRVQDMPRLTYTGYGWEMKDKEVDLGFQYIFSPNYMNEKISVEVPPETKAKVTYTLYYTRASQDGIIRFFNSESDQDIEVDFTSISIYPTSCDYYVEYE